MRPEASAHDAQLSDLGIGIEAVRVKRSHHGATPKRAKVTTLGGRRAGRELARGIGERELACINLVLDEARTATVAEQDVRGACLADREEVEQAHARGRLHGTASE
eukprot:CAMPEP_0174720732 /NCGR_PEP_ID=MMETSP1094-20130205/34329_1 /TAXON_ID=156173 /ORGANISM="Chrysochromulina brevifilum, Strain UTEX LB 985" /LENGTH=105 /DNA_ID=CAMNT_0015921265 /DNA_START=315 /DNA_END=632 /DNA_ORIENTATION=-